MKTRPVIKRTEKQILKYVSNHGIRRFKCGRNGKLFRLMGYTPAAAWVICDYETREECHAQILRLQNG